MTLFTLNPNQPLNHFEYAPVQAEVTRGLEQDAFELSHSLEALSELHNELTSYLTTSLSQLHQFGSIELNDNAVELHSTENEQENRGHYSLAMIKSNLRLFLHQITAAFKGLFGQLAASNANPLLAISSDLDPLQSTEMKGIMKVSEEHEEKEFGGTLEELIELLQGSLTALLNTKDEINAQFLEELASFEDIHRLKEEKNEQGRQSVLKFIAAIETAAQILLNDKKGEQQPPPYSE